MEESFGFNDIWRMLKKRVDVLLICIFIGFGVAGYLTFFVIEPLYSSQTQLLVNLSGEDSDTAVSDLNTSIQLVSTYKEMITGDVVLSDVSTKLLTDYDENLSISELQKIIEVEQKTNSLIFSIKATTNNAMLSADVVNTTAEIFKEKSSEKLAIDKVDIISEGEVNLNPVYPNHKLLLIIGIFIGAVVGIIIIIIMLFFDKTVKDEEFFTNQLGYPVLGTVPSISVNDIKKNNFGTVTPNRTEHGRRSRSR